MKRYERDRIEELRVETLRPRQWVMLEVSMFDPRFFFGKSTGLRFRYRKPQGGAALLG
jgi:hypothetical protein